MGPGGLGPVRMKRGGGAEPGLPSAPARSRGALRWFFIGLATGVVATLLVITLVVTFTQ